MLFETFKGLVTQKNNGSTKIKTGKTRCTTNSFSASSRNLIIQKEGQKTKERPMKKIISVLFSVFVFCFYFLTSTTGLGATDTLPLSAVERPMIWAFWVAGPIRTNTAPNQVWEAWASQTVQKIYAGTLAGIGHKLDPNWLIQPEERNGDGLHLITVVHAPRQGIGSSGVCLNDLKSFQINSTDPANKMANTNNNFAQGNVGYSTWTMGVKHGDGGDTIITSGAGSRKADCIIAVGLQCKYWTVSPTQSRTVLSNYVVGFPDFRLVGTVVLESGGRLFEASKTLQVHGAPVPAKVMSWNRGGNVVVSSTCDSGRTATILSSPNVHHGPWEIIATLNGGESVVVDSSKPWCFYQARYD